MPVSSASSPVDTAGSIATTIRTKSGIFRWTGQRVSSISARDQRAPGTMPFFGPVLAVQFLIFGFPSLGARARGAAGNQRRFNRWGDNHERNCLGLLAKLSDQSSPHGAFLLPALRLK